MSFSEAPNLFLKTFFIALTAFSALFVSAPETDGAVVVVENKGILGIIKGSVRDEGGNPIADAYVSIFRIGTSELLKQVRSSANGSFLAKVLPGTYKVLAVAEGFNAITYDSVEVNRSAELSYRFNLERAGSGNTLPEKRLDRNSSKWRIRQSAINSSIYQNREGKTPIDEDAAVAENQTPEDNKTSETLESPNRRGQTVVETFAANVDGETFAGANFATLVPVTETTQIVFAGQTSANQNAPQRFEVSFKSRLNDTHQIRLNAEIAKLCKVQLQNQEKSLGQFFVQATDEWRVRK